MNQEALIENAASAEFVLMLRPVLAKATDRVYETTYATFRRWFLACLKVLGCDHLGFKSHSLRRGGATARALAVYTMVHIMIEGRWSSESLARLYLETSQATVLSVARDLDVISRSLVGRLAPSWNQAACAYMAGHSRE
jgi:hypothetical protein